MPLSSTGLQSALAEWTDEVWLECLTFDHADLAAPIRLVNNTENITRTAGTFIAFPFGAKLHETSDSSVGEAMLRADGVDQSLVEELRQIESGLVVTYEVVLADTPNTVEHGPIEYTVRGFVSDGMTISMAVAFALDFLNEAFPKDWFAPWNAGT